MNRLTYELTFFEKIMQKIEIRSMAEMADK